MKRRRVATRTDYSAVDRSQHFYAHLRGLFIQSVDVFVKRGTESVAGSRNLMPTSALSVRDNCLRV